MSRSAEVPERADRPTGTGFALARFATTAALAATIGVALALRFITSSDLWFDEALSVNIARLPLAELGDALRQDGAPPLYYLLLHVWIDFFGSGDTAVRALSAVFSIGALPLAYLAGRRVGGRRAAWAAVLLLASSPYAIRYATETRMYALVMFLALWGYLAVRRALELPSRGRLGVVALVTAALVYSQYWSFYLVGTVGIGLAYAAWRGPGAGRRPALRVVLAIGVGGAALLPWLDTLLFQLGHTGTPWGDPVVPWYGLALAMSAFAGGSEHAEAWLLLLPLLVLPFVGMMGRALDSRRIELDLRTRPEVRWEGAAAFGTLVCGLVASWVGGTAFDGRYAAIMFPLLVVVLAFSMTLFVSTRVRVGVLAALVALGLAGGLRNVTNERTQAGEIAEVISSEARPGDLVLYCPDQIGPDTSRLLEGVRGLRQEVYPDRSSPLRVDWVDYRERIARQDPEAFGRAVVETTDPTATIWFVNSSDFRHVGLRCDAVGGVLGVDRTPTVRVFPDADILEHMGLTQFASP